MTRGSGGVRSWTAKCRYCGKWYRYTNWMRRRLPDGTITNTHLLACEKKSRQEMPIIKKEVHP